MTDERRDFEFPGDFVGPVITDADRAAYARRVQDAAIDRVLAMRDHEPSRRGLVHASGLLPVDHPQFWTGEQLVRTATRHYYRNR